MYLNTFNVEKQILLLCGYWFSSQTLTNVLYTCIIKNYIASLFYLQSLHFTGSCGSRGKVYQVIFQIVILICETLSQSVVQRVAEPL